VDFRLTKEQADIRKAAMEFAGGEFDADLALEWDSNQHFPETLWERACSLGFIGLQYPEDYGGQGLGSLENSLVTEVFCRYDSGIGIALALCDFGAELVVESGSEEQRRQVLPLLAQGKGLLTLAVLEDGYALMPFATRAVESDSGYRISGEKFFVTLGDLASFVIVACQNPGEESAGQCLFLVESASPGLRFSSMGDKLGMRMVPTARLEANDLYVPETALIGDPDSGRSQLTHFLHAARVRAGAMGIGVAQGAFDRALDYSRKRRQFGKPIAAFELIRNKLADMLVEVEMARLLVYRAAWSLDHGQDESSFLMMAKMVGVRTAVRAASEAVQIHGGYGYMKEGRVERYYRDAKVLDLFLEPPQVQRSMLADLVTGRGGTSKD
jgi:alkylation response protein AidB-like acyl-CoA dehydrogenase